MLYVMVLSIAATAALLAMLLLQVMVPRPRSVTHRLTEIQRVDADPWSKAERRKRQGRLEGLNRLLQAIGDRLQKRYEGSGGKTIELLVHAGYREPNALGIYWAARIFLGAGLATAAFFLATLLGVRPAVVIGATLYTGAIGFVFPVLVVRRKKRERQHEIQLALPDALDLLVICVEAGLGLNQALVRVAEEIRHVSTLTSDELTLVNLEIRAGVPRDVALMNLAARTGVADVRSLTTMLIQTDRFGTSIAQSLRVHSDTLRQKRRQRAEEAAAKTTIKMVFPLVLCIFPAMFVVLIGPGLIQIFRAFTSVQ